MIFLVFPPPHFHTSTQNYVSILAYFTKKSCIYRDLELVESLGSGIPRIMQAYGEDSFRFTANFIRITLPINPLFLSQLGAENEQDTVQDNTTENQGVNIDEALEQALSWHPVGTQSAPSQYLILKTLIN